MKQAFVVAVALAAGGGCFWITDVCGCTPADPVAGIQGVVTSDNGPVSDVQVHVEVINTPPVMTDLNGRYDITLVHHTAISMVTVVFEPVAGSGLAVDSVVARPRWSVGAVDRLLLDVHLDSIP